MRGTWLAGAALALAASPASAGAPGGVWINPHRSVAVRTGSCGDRLCGWIVWASPQARADAADSGVAHLSGLELLQDYRASGGGWSGRVFVPDMGRSFSSTISTEGGNGLRIRGCLIGGFFCKTQLWTRVAEPPHA